MLSVFEINHSLICVCNNFKCKSKALFIYFLVAQALKHFFSEKKLLVLFINVKITVRIWEREKESDEARRNASVCELTGIFSLHQIKSASFITHQVSKKCPAMKIRHFYLLRLHFLCSCLLPICGNEAFVSQGNC